MQGTVVAVCTSSQKGQRKVDVGTAMLIAGQGIEGDAHAGFAHRQISLLSVASIDKMKQKCGELVPGDFAENLTVEGLDLPALLVGTVLHIGEEQTAVAAGSSAEPDVVMVLAIGSQKTAADFFRHTPPTGL